uniref:Uncharacterized protein n=1 Tax=Oryza barthii TaxID=65489 RepID=A0A0D3FIV4_9ORYZ
MAETVMSSSETVREPPLRVPSTKLLSQFSQVILDEHKASNLIVLLKDTGKSFVLSTELHAPPKGDLPPGKHELGPALSGKMKDHAESCMKERKVLQNQNVVIQNEFEKDVLSDVIPPNDVGVHFEDIGALENVKDTLKKLVMSSVKGILIALWTCWHRYIF